jgi:hypothetical protein
MGSDEALARGFDAGFLNKNGDAKFRCGSVPVPDISADTLLGCLLAKSPSIKSS